ncbi:MAG: hypothetical protein RL756_52 [Pseudomonadota bacterium]
MDEVSGVTAVDFHPARDGPIRRKRQHSGIVTSYTLHVA